MITGLIPTHLKLGEITVPVSTSKAQPLSEKAHDMQEPNPALTLTAPAGSSTLSSHGTQTDIDDAVSVRIESPARTPSHSRSNSRTRLRAPIATWHDQLRNRLSSSPHTSRTAGGPAAAGDRIAHLAAPATDPLNRPSTPRADLYKGQSEACFGMTFESSTTGPGKTNLRKANKPTASPYSSNYEDKKHRMLMDWLERKC